MATRGGEVTHEGVEEAANYIRERTDLKPGIGVVCGSGLGGLADKLQDSVAFEYKDIPNFLVSTVSGHAGKLVIGNMSGHCLVCMQGRFHLYEGHPLSKITFPIRVMKELGVNLMIVTNATGALNPSYKVGDVIILKDHLSFPALAGYNPIVGINDVRLGPRFFPMSDAYDKALRNLALETANEINFDFVKEGVLGVVCGPCYESVTECAALRILGCDVAGMSVAPEVTVARQCGQRVLAFSLVTNLCNMEYDTETSVNHQEVLDVGRDRAVDVQRFLARLLSKLTPQPDSCNCAH